jgi:hypothetical protein
MLTIVCGLDTVPTLFWMTCGSAGLDFLLHLLNTILHTCVVHFPWHVGQVLLQPDVITRSSARSAVPLHYLTRLTVLEAKITYIGVITETRGRREAC